MNRPRPPEIQRLFDRPPPHSIEAEMALLGSMIVDPKVIPDMAERVDPAAFYREAHATVYDAIRAVHAQSGTFDLVQLLAALEASGRLADVGGVDYLARLADAVPSAASAPHYAKIVAERHSLRKLVEAAGQAIYDAYNGIELGAPVESVLSKASGAIAEAVSGNSVSDLVSYADAAKRVVDAIYEGKPSVFVTGFTPFDHMFAGIPQSGITYIAGVRGSGKSTLALQLAYGIASQGHPFAVFSFEVDAEGSARNLLGADAMAPLNAMARRGERFHAPSAERRTQDALSRAADVPLYFIDGILNIQQIEAKMAVLSAKGFKGAVIDYIQNVPVAGKIENDTAKLALVCNTLQHIQVRHKLCIIALSQMTLASSREDREPRLSDMVGTGKAADTASMAMAVYSPAALEGRTREDTDETWGAKCREAWIKVVKSKTSELGILPVRFEGAINRFFARDEEVNTGGDRGNPLVQPQQKELDIMKVPVSKIVETVDEEVPF
jgi:replicative DNA helicase